MHEGLEQIFYSYSPKLEAPLKVFLQSVFLLVWAPLHCFLELRPVRYVYEECLLSVANTNDLNTKHFPRFSLWTTFASSGQLPARLQFFHFALHFAQRKLIWDWYAPPVNRNFFSKRMGIICIFSENFLQRSFWGTFTVAAITQRMIECSFGSVNMTESILVLRTNVDNHFISIYCGRWGPGVSQAVGESGALDFCRRSFACRANGICSSEKGKWWSRIWWDVLCRRFLHFMLAYALLSPPSIRPFAVGRISGGGRSLLFLLPGDM